MAIILTRDGRTDLARSFFRDLVNVFDYFYLTIGKTTAWADEEEPDVPVDSNYVQNEFRKNIMFVQNATDADVCHLARRINWVSGTVYDQYDDSYGRLYTDVFGQAADDGRTYHTATSGATNLADANFYVVTDEFKVYKCLGNNNGAASTVKPTDTGVGIIFSVIDGYTWKFMFQISASDQTKFLDTQFIPVRKLTSDPYGDVNGIISDITITDGGSGYTTAPAVTIVGDGKRTPSSALPTATATVTAGVVTDITVTNNGYGYSYAFVTIEAPPSGTTATAVAVVGDDPLVVPTLQSAVEVASSSIAGAIDRIEVITPGVDYAQANTNVVITGDGTGAEASVTVNADLGQITGITVTNGGTGYTWAEIEFQDSTGAVIHSSEASKKATTRAVLAPIKGHGAHSVDELFAHRLGIVINLSDVLNTDYILDNDFRQVGLIKNIKKFGTTENYTSTTGRATYRIEVGSTIEHAKYNVDDVLTTNDGGKFTVTHKVVDGSNYYVFLQPQIGLISASSSITNTTTSVSGLSINSYTAPSGSSTNDGPEVDVTTGDVVYIENRAKINRQDDQVETIKAIISF